MKATTTFICRPAAVLAKNSRAITAAFGLFMLTAGSAAKCQQMDVPTIRVNVTTRLNSVGGAHVEATTRFEPAKIYDTVRATMPNLYVLFRDVIGNYRSSMEVEHDSIKITPDDNNHAILFKADYIGATTLKDDTWKGTLDQFEEVISDDSEKVITQMVSRLPSGWVQNGTAIYYYPPGAKETKVDKERHTISYRLPRPVIAPTKIAAKPKVDVMVRTKKKLMSSLYKIYADQEAQNGLYWAAKTIVKNTGETPIYDVKITYRLGELADPAAAHTVTCVVPKGAVVDLYYPFLSSKVAQLKTRTPAQLVTTCTYKDGAGKSYTEEMSDTLDVLGINQFEYSNLLGEDRVAGFFDNWNNAPLLAAYVTKMDDPVKMFAGWISEASGGAGAALTDDDARKWMRAAYVMELENNIVYQTPSSDSFSQDIKYPRDVFRAKSGTCVDLAILYASLAESVGLQAHLMMVPGHCFAVIRLPKSGNWVAVENTGLGGGNQRMSYDQAVEMGNKEFQDYMSKGAFFLINVREKQEKGRVPSPELPQLESDFLEKCGLHRHVGGVITAPQPRAQPQPQAPAPGGGAPNPGGVSAPPDSADGFAGLWQGMLGTWKLTINLQQDGTLGNGTMTVQSGFAAMRGSFRKATLGKDGSLKILAVVEGNGGKLSITLEGNMRGRSMEGSGVIIERNLLGIKVRESTVSWTAIRG